jgi:hypothetical protein
MSDAYSALAELIAAWFHQDFEVDGSTVPEVMHAYRAVTPTPAQAIGRRAISYCVSTRPGASL